MRWCHGMILESEVYLRDKHSNELKKVKGRDGIWREVGVSGESADR